MRAVLDTNVIIAPFLSPKGVSSLLLKAWEEEAFDLVVSEALLIEYQDVLLRQEIAARHKMDQAQVESVIEQMRKYAVIVAPDKVPKVVKEDPDDDELFAAAIAGEASYIMSKNNHVLKVEEYKGIQVLTPLAFLAVLEIEK